jgi:TfoX/Sxy family transcriptional regulator of competence genes
MPAFSKSPPELVERFKAITAEIPDVERRQMFGYPCLFVGGNMITGLHGPAWFVRLSEPDAGELLRVSGSGRFEVMPGRAMAGYTVLSPSIVADDRAVRDWATRAIEFGRSLPPRVPKAPKAPKPKRSQQRPGI